MPLPLTIGSGRALAGARGFQLADIAGLVADWDASAITGVADGVAAPTFPDRVSGKDGTQATGGKQAIYRASSQNGKPGLEFAAGQCYQTTAIDLSGTNALTLFLVLVPGTTGVDQVLVEMSADFNAQTDSFILFQQSTNKYLFNQRGTGYASYQSDYPVTFPRILCATADRSLAAAESSLYANSVLLGTRPQNSNNTTNFGNRVFNIGARNNAASLGYTGLLYRIVLYNRALTTTERQQVETHLNGLYRIYFDLTGPDFSDNNYNVATANYIRVSCLARALFSTDATKVEIDSYNDIYTILPTLAEIGVRTNGADVATLAPGAAGQAFLSTNLAGGAKTVDVVTGVQSNPSGTVLGTFARTVTFGRGTSSKTGASAANRILVYGDSIPCGANATNAVLEGWVQLLRNAATGHSVALEAWGYRSLYDDANTAPLRAVLVAQIAALQPTVIWLSIGTNDYGLNKWSAASFGTAYAALLDDLHAALPSATIYCQTPVERVAPGSEAANGSGSTLGNYRTQISTAVSTRGPWAVLVAGTGILNSGTHYDTDGIHPNTAGQAALFTSFRGTLGI